MTRGTAAAGGVGITLAGACSVVTPRGSIDGGDLSGPSAEVVFARLVLAHGTSVSRDVLAEALWGDRPPRSWQPALRNVIARLRAAFEGADVAGMIVLGTAGDGYRLDLPADTRVDIEELEPSATRAESAAALGDHAGALEIASAALTATSGTVLAGTRGDWVDALRADVGRRRERLARIAGEAALALGDHAEAERLGRELVRDLPLREDGYRLLMRALNAAGNAGEALTVYDDCRRVLEDELGTVPSEATQTLFLGILREERAAPRVTPGAGRLLLLDRQTPFVGRAEALDRLTGALDAAREDGPRVVAIGGEPGLGKTRLAAALAARAHEAGWSALYGRADDRIAAPYGPFLEGIDGFFASVPPGETAALLGRHAGVLSRIVPSIAAVAAPSESSGSPDLNQLHLATALEHALGVIAGAGGALLVLDDMQWSSSAARALVEHLAAPGGERLPLLVVAVHRSGQPLFGGGVESFELDPLTVADVAALARLHGDGDEEAAARVWSASGGNALLATELLAAQAEDAARPARIDEIVRARLAQLPRETEDVLRIAAVAGLEFDPEIVAAASSADPVAVAAALAHARDARLLVDAIGRPGWLAFRHGLVRASLLDAVDSDLGMHLHQRLGQALESRPAGGASNARLAYHFGAAAPLGDWRAAVRYGLPVARAAFEAGFHEDAIGVARRTLGTLADAGDPDPLTRLDLEIVAGSAERALGDLRGHETLGTAFAGAAALGDATRMTDAVLGYTDSGAATEEAHIDDLVLPLYEQALEALGSADDGRRARLLGRIAMGYAWARNGDRARDAREQARSIGLTLADEAALGHVLASVRRSMIGTFDVEAQLAVEDSLLELAARRDDPRGRARALLWRFETSVEAGAGDELEGLLDDAGGLIAGLPDAQYHHTVAYNLASLELIRGDVDRADRAVEHAFAVGRAHGLTDPITGTIRIAQLMGVRAQQGRLAELRAELAPFVAAAPDLLGMRVLLAWVDAELGELGGVAETLDDYFDDFARNGVRSTMPLAGLAHLSSTVAHVGDLAKAEWAYEMLTPHSGRTAPVNALSTTDLALGRLARMLGREDDARRHFSEGVAFADRLGAPLVRARCEDSLAPAH